MTMSVVNLFEVDDDVDVDDDDDDTAVAVLSVILLKMKIEGGINSSHSQPRPLT